MNIEIENKVNIKEWTEIANECEYATFFHTPAWAKIFINTYPNMSLSTKKIILNNKKIVILPMISVKEVKGLFKKSYSMFPGVYGGIISKDKLDYTEIKKIFDKLILFNFRTLEISIMGNPFFPFFLSKKYESIEDFTQIVYLNRDENRIWSGYKPSVRNKITKAIKAGIKIKEAETFSEWKDYYSVYEDSIKRWGQKATSRYPFLLFENIYKMKNKNIKLWLVLYNEKIVGGNLNLYHNRHCVEWHASFLKEYFKYGIRNFLVHQLILDAKKRGYLYYDFNPSGGHEGVIEFKKSFNSKKLYFKKWKWENKTLKNLLNLLKI